MVRSEGFRGFRVETEHLKKDRSYIDYGRISNCQVKQCEEAGILGA